MKTLRLIPHHGGAPATSSPTNGARSTNRRAMANERSDFSARIHETRAVLSASRLAVSAALQAHIVHIAWALVDRIVWALGLATIALWRGVLPQERAPLKSLARNHT